MIDGFMSKAEIKEKEAEHGVQTEAKSGMKEYPEIWNKIVSALDCKSLTIPQIAEQIGVESNLVTWHLMTMNRYSVVESAGLNDDETYFKYKLKK